MTLCALNCIHFFPLKKETWKRRKGSVNIEIEEKES
jgi:hypothetical protein